MELKLKSLDFLLYNLLVRNIGGYILHPDTKQVHEHMRDFGCSILGRATYDATFSEMARPYVHASAITMAAHGAEIIIKARIAQEHPLLIFDQLPKSTTTPGLLTVSELFDRGKTIQYSDLPGILWASTGYRMKKEDEFLKFGKLRNKIMHFAVPEGELSGETLKFSFEVMDPMLEDFWDDTIVSFLGVWDEEIVTGGYLMERLKADNINSLTTKTTQLIADITRASN